MLTNLDTMYYRNRDIIANQIKCSRYKSLRSYSSCTETKIGETEVVDRDFEYVNPNPAPKKNKPTQ